MLYLIYGFDTNKAQNKYNDLIAGLQVKQPNSAVFLLNRENFNSGQWEELLVGQSLFYEKYIVGLNRLLGDKEFGENITENLMAISQSPHIFILIEESVDLKIFEQVEKLADKILFFKKADQKIEEKSNEFAVAEALAQKDKKKLWLEYNRSLVEGKETDMIFGQIWWQLRMLLVAKTTKQKIPKSIKPFVFNRATRGASNYSEEELKNLASRLVNFYHCHFAGSEDFSFGLEKIILEI